LVSGDPLHIEKGIRYRWVCSTFLIGYGSEENISFSLERIQMTQNLSPTVFSNAASTKMHNSPPLRLFSPLTLAMIFQHELGSEVMIALWCLLNAALTLPGYSTTTRVDLLLVGYWLLFFHFKLGEKCGYPRNVHAKIILGQPAQLCTRKQLRDAINIVIALITIVRPSDDSVALDRIGSSPLEHAFGNMRIRCRDVHTLEKMIAAFTSIELASIIPSLQNLQRIPRRHLSMGVRCESFIHS
jgi:hypothetical protein